MLQVKSEALEVVRRQDMIVVGMIKAIVQPGQGFSKDYFSQY